MAEHEVQQVLKQFLNAFTNSDILILQTIKISPQTGFQELFQRQSQLH